MAPILPKDLPQEGAPRLGDIMNTVAPYSGGVDGTGLALMALLANFQPGLSIRTIAAISCNNP
jgi:hypothetical protein